MNVDIEDDLDLQELSVNIEVDSKSHQNTNTQIDTKTSAISNLVIDNHDDKDNELDLYNEDHLVKIKELITNNLKNYKSKLI